VKIIYCVLINAAHTKSLFPKASARCARDNFKRALNAARLLASVAESAFDPEPAASEPAADRLPKSAGRNAIAHCRRPVLHARVAA
jgi:hypothetical protein